MKVELDADGTWKGDPGDGTDFIPVVDIPPKTRLPFLQSTSSTVQPLHRFLTSTHQLLLLPEQAGSTSYDFSNLVKSNGVLRSDFRRLRIPAQQRLQLPFFTRMMFM